MKVINSPHGEVINRPKSAKKKSPFKNTLKKKNGIYNLGNLIKRARAQARAYARHSDGAVPEMVAAVEAVGRIVGALDAPTAPACRNSAGRPPSRLLRGVSNCAARSSRSAVSVTAKKLFSPLR